MEDLIQADQSDESKDSYESDKSDGSGDLYEPSDSRESEDSYESSFIDDEISHSSWSSYGESKVFKCIFTYF